MEAHLCGVCGQQGHGIHFGINACRACSSFFRRTVAERKSYVCRLDGNCMIKKGLRNACRACRFKKCFEAGMKPDNRHGIIHFNEDGPSSADSITQPSTSSTPTLNSPNNGILKLRECRCLYDFVQTVHNYLTSDKSLFTVEHPEHIFRDIKFTPLDEVAYRQFLKSNVTLSYSMLTEFFKTVGECSQLQKIDTLKAFFHEYQILYQAFQTFKSFKPNEGKIFFRYGYYIDVNDLGNFFIDKDMGDKAYNLFLPFITRFMAISEKMREFDITEIEFSAVVGTLFFRTLETLNLSNDETKKRQNDLFADLNHHLIHVYGIELAGARMGNLLCLLLDVKDCQHMMNESVVIAKVFLPNFNDYWSDAMNC